MAAAAEGVATFSLVFVRHGQTFGNAKKHTSDMAERGDDMLTARGQEEARLLGRDHEFIAKATTFDMVIVSPLRRALHTALLIFSSPTLLKARQKAGRVGAWYIVARQLNHKKCSQDVHIVL